MPDRFSAIPAWAWIIGAVLVIGIVLVSYRIVQTQRHLESELESAKQAADRAKAEAAELEKRAAGLNSELEKVNTQRNELQVKLDDAASEVKLAQSQLADAQSGLEATQRELESTKQAADQAKAKAAEFEKRAGVLNSELEEAKAQREELQIRFDEARSEVKSVQSRLADMQSRLEAIQAELEGAKQAADQAKAKAAEFEKRAASLNSELEKANTQRNELQTKLDEATSEIQRLKSQLEQGPRSESPVPANELFASATLPAPLAARSIGSYAKGCLAGGVALPINGPDWQMMRLSRNRNWGNPRLVKFLEEFARDARVLDGWPGLLVGDMSQPRGGPMIAGHASHQIGLDIDIWLTPMPDRILTAEEREKMSAVSMLKDPFTVDPEKWTPLHTKLLKRAASYPEVDRIFVYPAIKKVLCEQAGENRAWLIKVRPWWNHYYHFHVRLICPLGDSACEGHKPASGDDGCGQELANWYAKLKEAAIASANLPPRVAKPWRRKGRLMMADLPAECRTVLTAGGFEPTPANANSMPAAVQKALASKEAGPPLPRLDAAAVRALTGLSAAAISLPVRNPIR
jgi:penicillin-insensitive murein endopeptidase